MSLSPARYTDRARKVMMLANQEAQRLNHPYIGTEHILLGLVKEGSGVAANVLQNVGSDLRKIRLEVERLIPMGRDTVTMGKLPQTPPTKKAVDYATEEARNFNHKYVGTEHLLLGLLREREGIAAQVLTNLGLKLEELRHEVLNLLGQNGHSDETGKQSGKPGPPKDTQAELRDLPPETLKIIADLDARIEQITQVKEAAVAEFDFEKAANLFDEALKLKKQRADLIQQSRKHASD
jgi:ATP-dependent Clp protease ATP-binding subunit ClpA